MCPNPTVWLYACSFETTHWEKKTWKVKVELEAESDAGLAGSKTFLPLGSSALLLHSWLNYIFFLSTANIPPYLSRLKLAWNAFLVVMDRQSLGHGLHGTFRTQSPLSNITKGENRQRCFLSTCFHSSSIPLHIAEGSFHAWVEGRFGFTGRSWLENS